MRILGLVAVLFVTTNFCAFTEDAPPEYISAKNDTWMEGTIMMIDADGGKLSVRGAKKPYASSYAKMLREIDTQTRNLDTNVRAQKIAEMRAANRETLRAAVGEKSETESDFTFYIPSKEVKDVHVIDETETYGVFDDKIPATAAFGTTLNKEERDSMAILKDLKVGQRVVIGYARGVVYNNVYSIIKVAGGSVGAPVSASHTVTNPDLTSAPALTEQGKDIKTGIHPSEKDLAITTAIRRTIIADKNLSVAAHNVKIFTENGIVTLRGAVNSENEKQSVFEKAAANTDRTRIVNELEVKP